MSELPDTFDLEQCARYLRELAAADSPVLPIGEAALALASFERPRVALARYRQHLTRSPAMSAGMPMPAAISPRGRGRSTRSSC